MKSYAGFRNAGLAVAALAAYLALAIQPTPADAFAEDPCEAGYMSDVLEFPPPGFKIVRQSIIQQDCSVLHSDPQLLPFEPGDDVPSGGESPEYEAADYGRVEGSCPGCTRYLGVTRNEMWDFHEDTPLVPRVVMTEAFQQLEWWSKDTADGKVIGRYDFWSFAAWHREPPCFDDDCTMGWALASFPNTIELGGVGATQLRWLTKPDFSYQGVFSGGVPGLFNNIHTNRFWARADGWSECFLDIYYRRSYPGWTWERSCITPPYP